MADPEVERTADDRPAGLVRAIMPEVVPQAERDRRELQPAAAAAAVLHPVVACGCRDVHGATLAERKGVARDPRAEAKLE